MRSQKLLETYAGDILHSKGMDMEKRFFQHGTVTVFDHSVAVALTCLQLAALLRLRTDTRSLVRGALLHDYFLYDWHIKEKGRPLHGTHHARRAMKNAERDFGLNKMFQTNSTTIAIFLAAAVAILIWVILNKTTFGYELKAVGLNKSAARYAGINEKKNIILSMAIAGALAGFGAGLFYLSNVGQWNPLNSTSLPAMGFNGISVALLASSNPIGTIFSAIFISHISVGGTFLSTKYYPTEIADLISGIIIYLCAFSMLFRGKIQKLLFKNADKTNVNAEPAPAEKANVKKEGK